MGCGMKTIELGAGVGLAGIYAAMRGANVTLTDRQSVIDLLARNAKTNVSLCATRPVVLPLQWGSDVSHFLPPFQLVLGADIIYDPRGFKPLLWTLLSLTGMESIILISYRKRRDTEKSFF